MLSTTHLSEVGNFDTTTTNQLRVALRGGIDAVSAAGAVDLTKYVTELTVASTVAYTMAAPSVDKQRKLIRCVAATSTPLGTVTVTNPDATAGFVCPTTFTFTAVGHEAVDVSGTLKWRIHRVKRAGVQILVLGTTLTAGLVLAHTYSCSVTGTANSTGATKALPDGLTPGDFCVVACSTAACIPVGALDFTGVTLANAAVTHLQAIGVTTDTVTLTWNGAAWLVIANSGVTVA
jgi:hypothetical protein